MPTTTSRGGCDSYPGLPGQLHSSGTALMCLAGELRGG